MTHIEQAAKVGLPFNLKSVGLSQKIFQTVLNTIRSDLNSSNLFFPSYSVQVIRNLKGGRTLHYVYQFSRIREADCYKKAIQEIRPVKKCCRLYFSLVVFRQTKV